jgi:hypothetical protein
MTALDVLFDLGKGLLPVALGVNWVLGRDYWRSRERLAERERKLDDKIARALSAEETTPAGDAPQLFPPRLYELTRRMLAHAVHGELDALAILIRLQSAEMRDLVLDQCVAVADAITNGRSSNWPPNDGDLALLAAIALSGLEDSGEAIAHTAPTGLGDAAVLDYLSRVVVGGERVEQVFGEEDSAVAQSGRVPSVRRASSAGAYMRALMVPRVGPALPACAWAISIAVRRTASSSTARSTMETARASRPP